MDSLLYELRRIPLNREAARKELAAFLSRHALRTDPLLEGYFGIFRDEVLVAGAGYDRNIVKCVAVDDAYRGEGLLASLVTHIVTDRLAHGIAGLIVFTKTVHGKQFESLGFSSVAATPDVVLLTNDKRGFENYLENIAALKPPSGTTGGLVMNCNPFTLGHRHLIETAARHCGRVILFVVEEDVSAFPFAVRKRLVEEGVRDLPNVAVVPGGQYIVSSATFPTYFIKEESDAARTAAELDAAVFGSRIAPAAGITTRFVGEEPNSPSTAQYNAALLSVLPTYGVRVEIIPRLPHEGEPISASRVRVLIAEGKTEATRPLVPDSTYRYLASEEATPVREKLEKEKEREGKGV